MDIDYKSKEFQTYMLNYTIEEIKKKYNLKTKKEAKEFFYRVLSYNRVQEAIFNQLDFLKEEGEF